MASLSISVSQVLSVLSIFVCFNSCAVKMFVGSVMSNTVLFDTLILYFIFLIFLFYFFLNFYSCLSSE